MQSAYRLEHSTEMALLGIQNGMLRAIDLKKCVFLVLLDMSAAFDTVDHVILIPSLTSLEYMVKPYNGLSPILRTKSNL